MNVINNHKKLKKMKDLLKLANFVTLPIVLTTIVTGLISYSCSANLFKSPVPYFLFFVITGAYCGYIDMKTAK